jgi:hypothetical protein
MSEYFIMYKIMCECVCFRVYVGGTSRAAILSGDRQHFIRVASYENKLFQINNSKIIIELKKYSNLHNIYFIYIYIYIFSIN